MTVPTVDEVLARCEIRGWADDGSSRFSVALKPLFDWNGCAIPADDLRAALEDAYDPSMPNWPAMVQLDD